MCVYERYMRTEGCVAVATSSFSHSLYWPSVVARFCAEIGSSHMIDELHATINSLAQFGTCTYMHAIRSCVSYASAIMYERMTHHFRLFKMIGRVEILYT